MRSDVSAVVLSMGEPITRRAIESLEKQDLPPKEIILVENVTPSYRAGNQGVSKVKTEYLTVVGADVILDKCCISTLRSCMGDKVGIVLGHMRDSMIGRTQGIRLYRKLCFEITQMPNSISPDTDFVSTVNDNGWQIVYALRYFGKNRMLWHTFLDHDPEYTPLYTFSKYRIEGMRYRYWDNIKGMLWKFERLYESVHPMSGYAQIAMGHGFFINRDTDQLKPYYRDVELDFIENFINTENTYDINTDRMSNVLLEEPRYIFEYYYKTGINLRNTGSYPVYLNCLGIIHSSRNFNRWIALLGINRGLFQENFDEETFNADFQLLEKYLNL